MEQLTRDKILQDYNKVKERYEKETRPLYKRRLGCQLIELTKLLKISEN
ncbi:MAG: hypothetical protein J6Y02_11350 [Pseudobutyrivibrio sp.]|nr:hypothetical protein [Pseudobutyrivibrio sp.]